MADSQLGHSSNMRLQEVGIVAPAHPKAVTVHTS
eukprot:SAG31_NODE_43644_length_266_cov_0.622754_1_plen_33_part_10